ncbi:MAG TPA: hypothetical protein ENI23_05860 [bacterium]|nr:hypothetical protein [bacterium]
MVYLMLSGFHSHSLAPPEKDFDGYDIYHYRVLLDKVGVYSGSNVYFIFVLRDPRDVITSLYPSTGGKYLVDFGSWLKNYEEFLSLKERFSEDIIVIRYEDLITDPDSSQKIIADFIGACPDIPFSQCYKEVGRIQKLRVLEMSVEMGGVRPIEIVRVGRWKCEKYKDRLNEQYKRFPEMNGILRSLGYQ